MQKLIVAFVVYILLLSISKADTCPSIQDIQNNNFRSWKLYDSDTHQLLGSKQLSQFKKFAKQFTLVEWHQETKHSLIRCYYRDLNGSEAQAYLAKKDFRPHLVTNTWYTVSGSMHCAAGQNRCVFQPLMLAHRSKKTAAYNDEKRKRRIAAKAYQAS